MILLDPIWLLLGLAAIPILLLHAQRPRRQVVPSLVLWRTIQSSSASPRRLAMPRLTPSLLLQLAALAAITLAAADVRLVPDEHPDHTVLVIDSSAEMVAGGSDNFPFAQREAETILSVLEGAGTGLVSVISVEGQSRLLAARRDDVATARRDIADLSVSDQRADWAGTARWLETIIRPDERTQVHILSMASERLSHHYVADDLVFVSASPFATSDEGVVLRVDGMSFDRDRQIWEIRGHVRAQSENTIPQTVSLFYARNGDADFLDWGDVDLVASAATDETAIARFAARLSLPGDGRLVVDAAPGSGNAAHRYHAVLDTTPAEILIVGDTAPEMVRALGASAEIAFSESEGLPADTSAYDLVIVNGPRPQDRPNTNVVYLGASAIDRNQQPGATTTAELAGWNTQHPLSQDVDWDGIEALAYVEGSLSPGLVMVAHAPGNPILGTRTTATGREVYLSALLSDENWTQDPAFPLLMSNIVDWMQLSLPQPCVAGFTCPLDRHQRAAQIMSPDGEVVYDGARLPESGTAPEAEFRPRQAGFYTADGSVIAVNSAGYEAYETRGDGFEAWAPEVSVELRPWLIVLTIALLGAELLVYLYGRRLAGRGGVDLIARHRIPIAARGLTVLALGASLVPLALPNFGPSGLRVIIADRTIAPLEAEQRDIFVAANAPFAEDGPLLSGGRAIELGMALAPLPPRLALGSDVTGAGLLAEHVFAQGTPVIDILPIAPRAERDVSIVSIAAPDTVAMGETFRVTGLVHSDHPRQVRLITLRNGVPVDSRQLDLAAGLTRADVVLTPGSLDAELIEMVIEASDDDVLANNVDAALVTVVPSPRTLVVARDEDHGAVFSETVASQGLEVEVVAPNAAPRAIADWLSYEAIVLLDVGARDLRFDQLEQLQTAVSTFGKGLVIAGDANAFGAGGYYGTPLEALSPLSSRIPHDRPQTAIVFVVDRSGSMDAPVGPVTRLDIAKAALSNAADLMEPDDLLGIIGFDEMPQTIVPLQERGEDAIGPLMDNVVSGGGTILRGALDDAIGVLEAADASISHVVVITDGLVEPVDFSDLLDRAQAADITISTVAAGSSAVTDRLARIAEEGGGMYYATRDFQTLPAILMQDIMTLDEPVVVDEPAEVELADDGRRLGLNLATLPLLDRHVRTTAKPEARVMLTLANADDDAQPLAANWRYGAGMVAAFAMNPAAETAAPWAELEGFARLWSQTVRDVLPDMAGPGLNLRAIRQGDGFDIWAEVTGIEGQAISAERVHVAIAESGAPVDMLEISPGRYFGRIEPGSIGSTTLMARIGEIESQATLVQAYPSHLRHRFDDPRQLERLAIASGGEVLPRAGPLPTIPWHWTWQKMAWPWLLAALALFLIDILALRRGLAARRS